ncbi:GNAT family N-acetyltransferase [Pantoea agglomerans]|uniref:GNAT family N-acetyltransferase n=1 Tax=Enterobacter agglomerans TaxID=549 RepID=UPI000E213D8B|nr:GNAT family N-acetyltransferase [Pantoea agglomerans]MCH9406014.1 GNAT family N-acetyltransferase [Pantoea agglomerans]WNK32755.1 GNAT family N-acetyltransferase [Pantoea agglomerans]WNK64526.1 GNAT family N-acetyltransferase [Pantoea agglomerans]
MITLEKADPRSAESQLLITKLSAELAAITGDNGKSNFTMDSMDEERSLWVLARNNKGDAVGCGAIRPLTEHIAELKRMFSDRSSPAIGNALLTFLEKFALSMGYDQIWLATRSVNHKAVNFYQKNGYERIDNYGPYVNRDETVCFAKILSFRR